MNECRDITEVLKNMLKDLNIYELENIERNLLTLIKAEDKMSYFQNNSILDSDLREYYEIEEIEHYIEMGIINFGVLKIRDLVVDILQKKKNEYVNASWKFKGLQNKIVNWGRSRNINDLKGQFLKVIEEYGEIQLAKDKEELEDAIGDTLVTLIILNDISQRQTKRHDKVIPLIDMFSENDFYDYVKEKKDIKVTGDIIDYVNADTIIELSRIAEYISKMTDDNKEYHVEKIRLHISEVVKYVSYLAKTRDVDYIECLQLAYDTIANRKGKTIDGVFVKEEDL